MRTEEESVDEVQDTEEDRIAREIEEQAAAAVEEAAEEEEDDDADALDEDADSAQYDPERRHPLTDLPLSAEDVGIGHAFLTKFSETKSKESDIVVTLGETIKTVIAFANHGRGPYHVWGTMGSLNMKHNFKIHVQNFTYTMVNKTVAPDGELSFSYSFTPHERLDIRPFQLALTVFYEAQGSTGKAIRGHSTTFFNTTIATEPGPQSMSNGLFLLIVALVCGASAGGFFMFKKMESTKTVKTEMGTEMDSKNEWLEEHQAMMTGGGRARSRPSAKR
ncbi:translocon-associated protein alpha subunit [Gracilaria domingensis]|nr:translocon-associated protein alpha subunit [Gracilaria domingensis]